MLNDTQAMYYDEAFALMWYGCLCGHRERIWNSRDGVTPMFCYCPSCGELTLAHSRYQRDVTAPDHKPHLGQRCWRDGTPGEAAEFIYRRYVNRPAGEVDWDRVNQLIEQAREGKTPEFRPGWPMLVVVLEPGKLP